MRTSNKLIRSKLRRSDNSNNRLAYYTEVSFYINNNVVEDIEFKVDTGSPYTVVNLNSKLVESFKNIVLTDGVRLDRNVYDAKGESLILFSFIVDKFILTDDIVLDKVKIYFSEDIQEDGILGMDILSLFSFLYLQERNSISGSFWILDYDKSFQRMKRIRDNTGYYDQRNIMLLNDNFDSDLNRLKKVFEDFYRKKS